MPGPPPDPGGSYAQRVAKKKKVTWSQSLGISGSLWIHLPRPMTEDDFKLEGYKSLTSFIPTTFKRKGKTGQDRFHHAAELAFAVNHPDFRKDVYAAKIVYAKNGAHFHSVKTEDFDPVEKKLYLSGLPANCDWESVVAELKNFVDFYGNTSPAYYMEDGRHTGRRVVKIKKFRTVPTTRLYLSEGVQQGLGFSVFSVGHGQRQPVKPKRPCFCCHSFDHEVKNCPKKKAMRFSWECSQCGLSSVKY